MRRPLVYIALFFMGTILILDAFLGVKLYDEGKLTEHEGESVKISGLVQSFSEKSPEHIQSVLLVFGLAKRPSVQKHQSVVP